MKLPATLADLGLAAMVAWWFRGRPTLMVAGALAILLAPVVIYLSAWWGQFESAYVLPASLAVLLAIRRHDDGAAALAAVALMTKPQALPLVLPLAVWFLATTGWRGSLRAALVGVVVVVALWLPFLPSGGPAAYIDDLRRYADVDFSVISLRAWNPWWLAQLSVPGEGFVSDGIRLIGPITLRWVGLALAAIVLLWIGLRLARRPTPAALLWGTAAAALGTFVTLTEMHERYSFPALVLLVLLWPGRLAIATWAVLLVAVTANVVAAVPPDRGPGALLPLYGPVGALGAMLITACAVACLVGLWRATRADTSAGSGAATSAA
jgi:Gpi18-like mannosyltransferase